MEEENKEYYTMYFKLKNKHDSISMRSTLKEFNYLSKRLCKSENDSNTFIEIKIENDRKFFGATTKLIIVNRCEILEVQLIHHDGIKRENVIY